MEIEIILLLFVVELGLATFACIYWLKKRSELEQAKTRFHSALRLHSEQGTLHQFIEEVATGKTTIYRKRKLTAYYLMACVSMIAAVGLSFLGKFLGLWVAVRTIVGLVALAPFMVFVGILVAEELDENRIIEYESTIGKQLMADMEEGSLEARMAKISQG